MNNPFTLTFGALPEQFISRPVMTNRIIDDFTSDKPDTHVYMITGIRGSGKTVMLTDISAKISARDEWTALELNPEENIMDALASKLYNIEKIRPLFIKSKLNISFGGTGVSVERSAVEMTSEVVVEKMLDVLAKHNKRLLVTIDEAANNEYIKRFAHSFQIFIRQKYPIYLIMTGLYENIYNLQNEKTLTFLYRVPRFVLEPLSISPIISSYASIFGLSNEQATKMAVLTKGYPFAFQVLGYLKWENREMQLDKLIPDYDQYLSEYVYDKIWSELSDKDRRVVVSMAESDEYVRIQSLREKIGMNSSQFSTYRDRMIRKGLVDVSRYGYIGLILPRFREYAVKRQEYDNF